MVELSLILSIALLAATFAVVLARWSLSQAHGTAEASRVLGAVRRAGDDFTWRQSKRALLVGLLVGLVLLGLAALRPDQHTLGWQWTALGGVLLGALLCVAAGQLAVHLGPRASDRVSTAMRRATHTHAVSVGLRSGAAIGLATETLSLTAACGVLMIHPLGSAQLFAEHAAPLLSGIALGSVLVAALGQCSGGAMQTAGLAGRRQRGFDVGRERFDLNPHNPALVLDLMGNHVGVTAPRTQDAFSASCLAHCATVLLASAIANAQASSLPSFTALVALPVIIRAFGVMASAFSLLSTRADESDDPADVFWRGQVAMATISTASLAGIHYWIWNDGWLPWFAASALGLAANLVVVFSRQQLADRRTAAAKALRETAQTSSTLATSEAIGAALRASWLPISAIGLAAGAASMLGAEALGVIGGELALVLLVSGFCMALPYLQALSLLDPIVDGGCAMASLDDPKRPELHHRATRLNQAALSGGSAGQGYFITVSGLLGLPTTVWVSNLLAGEAAATSATTGLEILGGLVGLALVLTLAGLAVIHGTRAAQKTAADLDRQARSFISDGPAKAAVPADFRPRYGEALARAGAHALSPWCYSPLGALAAPACILALCAASQTAAHDVQLLLVSLLAFASITGLCVALIAGGSWSLLSSTRRHTRATNETHTSDLKLADSQAEFMGNTLCPAITLVTKGVLASGLVLASILF